jgi:pentatricopeptide repeat protein
MYWYYRRVFTTSPLERIAGQELPMLDPRGASTELMEVLFSLLDRFLVDRQPDDKVEPDTDTLVVMLIALIKDTNSMDNVFVFFTRFCRMLGQGDPLVCRLVREQTTRVYNAVIKRVAEFKGTIALRICRSIVYHMLQDQIGRPGGGEEGRRIEDGSVAEPSPEPQRHPAPDVRTWSILMHGYFGNGNVREANEILTLMRRHRVKPNLETWNTLAGGHSFHQDYEATVSTVRRIHEKGLQPDEYTNKSVLRLNDHPRALQMLRDDAAREESEADERAAEPATPGKSSGTPSEDERLQMELDYLSGLHAPGREM